MKTNDQAREQWRDDGTPCVADGHRWQVSGELSICRICGEACPRPQGAPLPAAHE
jgi:hypothetical protein